MPILRLHKNESVLNSGSFSRTWQAEQRQAYHAPSSSVGKRSAGTTGVKFGRPGIARNRAQVCVDREQIMIGHVRKRRPWHYLQRVPVEGKGQAVGRRAGTSTARVNVIEMLAVTHDLYEVCKRMASLRQPVLSGVRF
jgi:hypothetical protein